MKKLYILLIALVFSIQSYGQVNICYIYATDSTEGHYFKALMDSNGYSVTLLDTTNIIGYNFSKDSLIVIDNASDPNASYSWCTTAKATANKYWALGGEELPSLLWWAMRHQVSIMEL